MRGRHVTWIGLVVTWGHLFMNITSLLGASSSNLLGGSTTASQATSATSSVAPFLAQAEKRIQTDVDSTTAQLSKFGLLKSALADGQLASHALATLSSTAAPAAVTAAMGTFFNTFNAATSAANAAVSATGSIVASTSAKRVVSDLKATLRSSPATEDVMKKLGLTVQANGTLAQDPKKFAASLASDPSGTVAALAAIGKKVDAVATKELATNGSVGLTLATLNQHSTTLTAQQSALKSLEQAMTAARAAATTGSSASTTSAAGFFGSGLAAYQSNQTGF